MTTQLSLLTAVLPGREDPLRAYLSALPTDDRSPFASVAGTHNGRWVVMNTDPEPAARYRAGGLPAPMLMCSAVIDESPDAWLADLLTVLGERADEIWSHCAGWGRATDKAAFLMSHRVPATLAFRTWEAPAARIRTALANHRRVAALAVRAQHLGAADLLRAYREEMDG